jgi:hypothetical protein
MAPHRGQYQRKGVYHRGVVACRKCGAPVHVHKLSAVGDEFAVRCVKCGDRGFYSKREMVVEALPERRKKPRR